MKPIYCAVFYIYVYLIYRACLIYIILYNRNEFIVKTLTQYRYLYVLYLLYSDTPLCKGFLIYYPIYFSS